MSSHPAALLTVEYITITYALMDADDDEEDSSLSE